MIRQVTPVANAEIAIGRKIDRLERDRPADALREHGEDEPERGHERRHDRDPDRVVPDRDQQRRAS